MHFIGIYADIIMNFLSPDIGFVREIKVVYLCKFLCLLVEDALKQVSTFAFGLVYCVDVAVCCL